MSHESDEPLNRADCHRLRHMLEAARQATEFSTGREKDALSRDAMYRRATVSCLQEIGEAAVRVSKSTRMRVAIPWKQIIGMRNQLVHVYFDVNLELVWQVILKDLQPLITELERVLNQVDSRQDDR